MFCSWLISTYSLDKYKTAKNNNDMTDNVDNAKSLCFIAFSMLVIELALLVYALSYALSLKTESFLERFIHIFFAFFLTIPYILVILITKSITPLDKNKANSNSRFNCY